MSKTELTNAIKEHRASLIFDGLPKKIVRAFMREGINTIEDVRELASCRDVFMKIHEFGNLSYIAVLEWLETKPLESQPANKKSGCKQCKFWHEFGEAEDDETDHHKADIGNCHRFPPLFVGNQQLEAGVVDSLRPFSPNRWLQPVTTSFDWCGEYQPALP